MPKYKVSVSKWQKKYSIVLNAISDLEAKEKVHKEWYSVLAVELYKEDNITWNKFFFEAEKNGQVKTWQVIASDSFKVYLKLKDWLWYNVKLLYHENDVNKSEWEKKDLVRDLEEQYTLYLEDLSKSQKEDKEDENNLWNNRVLDKNKNPENFFLKKELEETYRMIDFVLLKIKNILDNSSDEEVDAEKKLKLKEVYNNITKLKKSTNLSKLKEVAEAALVKVWSIELEALEKHKDNNSRKLLKETNKLLKQVWSKEQFIEKDRDFNFIISSFISKVKNFFDGIKAKKDLMIKWDEIDKESYNYLKTELLIKKYNEKLKENTFFILKNFYKFLLPFWKNWEEKDLILLKRKVILQNILLLKAKKSWKLKSYTKLVKWYNIAVSYALEFLVSLNNYTFRAIFSFCILFLLYLFLYKNWILNFNLNYDWIFFLIFFIIAFVLVNLSKWLFSLIFSIVFLLFIFIFWIINF